MLLPQSFAVAIAVLSPLVSALAHERAASCLTCGGCAFELRASGTGISYIDGAYAVLGNFVGGSPAPYYFSAFGSSPGTTFKLDSACHLVAQAPTRGRAQVFSGADNKNHALYFAKGTATVGGKKLVPVTCSISTAAATLNQLTCTKAGSDTGLSFDVSRGTVEASQYEIGQDLLTDWKPSDVSGTYESVVLTAVKV